VAVDLRNRVAIVTGGGRGIGRAIALGYAAAGADVVISAARSPAETDEVVAAASGAPGTIRAVQADVTVPADVDRLVALTLSIGGRIDVLVNNAARGMRFINVTINHETMVRRGFSPYGPSKAALEAMTQVWAQELEGSGVHINLLAPGGATATGMLPDGAPPELKLLSPEIVVAPALELALTERSGQRILGTEWPGPQ
jgi:NAD(P)-dependent dehydrogenase (short-subunit alcohol dehydrogenase family)